MHFSMQCVYISNLFGQLQGIINYMCQLIWTINNKYVYTTKRTKHIIIKIKPTELMLNMYI